jgi:hypothetical protein
MMSVCADGPECLDSMKNGVSFPVECLSAAQGRLYTVELVNISVRSSVVQRYPNSFFRFVCWYHTCFQQLSFVPVFFSFLGWGETVHLVRRPLTGLLYKPRAIGYECGAVGGMRIGRGNRSTPRKLAPVPLCPPQIPHDLTWARPRAALVGSRRLTA